MTTATNPALEELQGLIAKHDARARELETELGRERQVIEGLRAAAAALGGVAPPRPLPPAPGYGARLRAVVDAGRRKRTPSRDVTPERGLEWAAGLADGAEWRSGELAKELGWSVDTARRVLVEMMAGGWVTQRGERPQVFYKLTPAGLKAARS